LSRGLASQWFLVHFAYEDEASTGVRPKITFEQFVDHTLLQEAKLQQERK